MKDRRPLVTVVIPTYNRATLAVEAVRSVCQQTYPNWEAVVVDDGSTDGTIEAVREFSRNESRVVFLSRGRAPKGACACRNIGLAAAKSDYVIFLDSDDLLSPTCLDQRAEAVRQNPEADFIVFQTLWFREKPDDLRVLQNTENGEADLHRFLRADPVWNISGPIWKRAALQKLGGLDEELSCCQDIDIHFHALAQGLKYLKCLDATPDIFIRRHSMSSISQDGFKSRETVRSNLRVYEKMVNACGARPDPGIRSGLRQMLAQAVQYALDARYFDLAERGIAAGRQDGVLSKGDAAVWQLAWWGYKVHSKGIRGCASLGKRLMRGYQPRVSAGDFRYEGDLPLQGRGGIPSHLDRDSELA